jgi:hypothetical protein
MEEIQPQAKNPPEKHGSVPLVFASLFAAIYFLFPGLLIYPVYLFYMAADPARLVDFPIDIVFYPDQKLYEHSAAYRGLIDWEDKLIGLDR